MRLALHHPDDLDRLREHVSAERRALQRDRYRAVLLVARDALEGDEVARHVGRSPRFVDEWVGRYRRGGLAALAPRKPPGQRPKLGPEQEAKLKERLAAGPTDADGGVCTLRGRDVVHPRGRVRREAHDRQHLQRAPPHRLLVPHAAPAAREERPGGGRGVQGAGPPFVRAVNEAVAPHGGNVRVSLTDEARLGQQGTVTQVWAPTGSRPTAVKQTRYEWVYLYAAVEPTTGKSVALLAPNVNTGTFNVFLKMLAAEVKPDEHVVLLMDVAGWHMGKAVALPTCVTVVLLPPYSPELNPVENLWHHLRSQYLSNRAYDDHDHLIAAGSEAWRRLTPEAIKSVCRCPYLERAGQV